MKTLAGVARLDDPTFYASDPFDVYRRLRDEAPVFRHEASSSWALSRYDHVRAALRQPTIFSSASGTLPTARDIHGSSFDYGGGSTKPVSQTMLEMDPPDHSTYRRAFLETGLFSPGWATHQKPAIRQVVTTTMSRLAPGETIDVLTEIAEPIAIGSLVGFLGLPSSAAPLVARWTADVFPAYDDATPEAQALAGSAMNEMFDYLAKLSRSSEQSDSLLARLRTAFEDAGIDERGFLLNAADLVLAGHETVRTAIAGGLFAFGAYPDAWGALRKDRVLLESATDEILRWVTPGIVVRRTIVARDVELDGQQLSVGDPVLLILESANRDERAFADPDRFDISRPAAPAHVAFGFGAHFCIGAPLARLEIESLLDCLVERVTALETDGRPERVPSTVAKMYSRVPLSIR